MNKISAIVPSKGKALLNQITADAGGMLGASDEVETSIQAPLRIGLTIAFLVFGVFGLWSLLAPIEGAAHAQGFITPRSFKKPIQHLEGGIVKEVLVQNGDMVQAGQVLFILDATRSQAELEIFRGQALSLMAQEARLLAERDNAEAILYPQEVQDAGDKGRAEINAQNRIFQTRKATRDGIIAVLEQRIGQLEARIEGMQGMRESKQMLSASFEEELASVQSLLADGFESKLRLRELERNHASLAGEAAELAASIAATQIQIGETRLEIQQQQNTLQSEVASELSQTQNQLKDTRERVITLTDIVARTEVRTPDTGLVNSLKIHSPGTVIAAGEVLAEVVPQDDELVIDAMVSLSDIDSVHEGQEASIRLPTFSAKRTPNFYGHVISVSADSLVDQRTGVPYYQARIVLDEESLAELQDLVLVPGMPAEVFISTGSRTFMQYLIKPLTDSWARSFREN